MQGGNIGGIVELDDESSGDSSRPLTTGFGVFEMTTDIARALFSGARILKNKAIVVFTR